MAFAKLTSRFSQVLHRQSLLHRKQFINAVFLSTGETLSNENKTILTSYFQPANSQFQVTRRVLNISKLAEQEQKVKSLLFNFIDQKH